MCPTLKGAIKEDLQFVKVALTVNRTHLPELLAFRGVIHQVERQIKKNVYIKIQ